MICYLKYYYYRVRKIKYANMKIDISQKCLNIFAPNFAHLLP